MSGEAITLRYVRPMLRSVHGNLLDSKLKHRGTVLCVSCAMCEHLLLDGMNLLSAPSL